MARFRQFELEAIRVLTEGTLDGAAFSRLAEYRGPLDHEHTGVGYFLTLNQSWLPNERSTLSEPTVVGRWQGVESGFVVFLGGNELTLECHTWGDVDIPADYREKPVEIHELEIDTDDWT